MGQARQGMFTYSYNFIWQSRLAGEVDRFLFELQVYTCKTLVSLPKFILCVLMERSFVQPLWLNKGGREVFIIRIDPDLSQFQNAAPPFSKCSH
jgi:hypothetical protein